MYTCGMILHTIDSILHRPECKERIHAQPPGLFAVSRPLLRLCGKKKKAEHSFLGIPVSCLNKADRAFTYVTD